MGVEENVPGWWRGDPNLQMLLSVTLGLGLGLPIPSAIGYTQKRGSYEI